MKNLKSLFLALAIVAVPLTFTSCGEENGYETIPNIALRGEITVVGNNYSAVVEVTSAETSRIRQNGVEAWIVFNDGQSTAPVNIPAAAISRPNGDDHTWVVTITFPRTANVAGNPPVEALRVRAETRDGGNRTVNFVIEREPEYHLLGEAEVFEWRRVGGNPAVGLEEFGLTWTANAGGFAIIARDAERFVQLPANSWTTITTQEALAAAVDAAENMTDFRGISSNAGATHNIVLATRVEGQDIMIHITRSTVTTGEVGTTITITGESKR